MQGELISIIIPVYNSEETVGRCIDSVLKQTYNNIEIILIDDGSVDRSKIICKEYQNKNKNIKLFSQKNLGVASARNAGLKLSNGKYIGFIDSDDIIKPDFLECLYDVNADISIGSCVDIWENGIEAKKSEVYKVGVYKKQDINFQKLYQTGLLGTCWGKLFKKELLKGVKFNENFEVCEDTIFVNQCYAKAKTVKLVKEIGYYYQIGNSKSLNNKGYTIELLNIHEKANKICIDYLSEDNSLDKQDLEFRRMNFLEYYANYFYFILFISKDSLVERKRFLKYLYKQEYYQEFQIKINEILSKESEKYKKIILLKKPLLELILADIQKVLRYIRKKYK